MGALYVGSDGKQHPIVMGCYGIGISRIAAAVVEDHHDDDGIIWPLSIAPFQVVIVVVNTADQAQAEIAERTYQLLEKSNLDALLDDRALPPGPKFKDADLVGIALQIIVGKKAAAGQVEVRRRGMEGSQFVSPEEAATWAQKIVQSEGEQ
jgi:prolyl-tRNA synthetase